MRVMSAQQTTVTLYPGDDPHVVNEPIPNILLRNARKQNGWLQHEVAEKIKVATVSVGRWERGEVLPNRYDRDLLCGLFHKSAEELGFPGGRRISVHADSQEPDQAHEKTLRSNRPLFREQLRHEREIRGWSQADLAEMIRCPRDAQRGCIAEQ
jgi:ribosome-binding protein aMBF1 (putative translation factor)